MVWWREGADGGGGVDEKKTIGWGLLMVWNVWRKLTMLWWGCCGWGRMLKKVRMVQQTVWVYAEEKAVKERMLVSEMLAVGRREGCGWGGFGCTCMTEEADGGGCGGNGGSGCVGDGSGRLCGGCWGEEGCG